MDALINEIYIRALVGGTMIGVSVSLMLLCFGRITGISGIITHAIFDRKLPLSFDSAWRIVFLIGMISGAALAFKITGVEKPEEVNANALTIILSGLLVGIGVTLANGCTSGHGICGVSRLSVRSVVATLCFMLSAMLMVFAVRHLF